MLITDETFQAFLRCESKFFFKSQGKTGSKIEIVDWQQYCLDSFRQQCLAKFRANLSMEQYLVYPLETQFFENKNCKVVLGYHARSQEIQSNIDALERAPSSSGKSHSPFIPIRFFSNEKITKLERLLVAFDALSLLKAWGKLPKFGKIIHGSQQKHKRVDVVKLVETVRELVETIRTQQINIAPQLILNRHCTECEFESRCHETALENEELTLLSKLSKKERQQFHDKGIFSVTQLSHTFRARRPSKRSASIPQNHSHSLRALAIRENKIYVTGEPKINLGGTPVFLDVEGVPDQDFYYLIGLNISGHDSNVQHSFWADEKTNERQIWDSTIRVLLQLDSPRLFHYGSYETTFLKKMKERYPDTIKDLKAFERLIEQSVNLVSVIYAQIYFPTYSNSLKDIARHLGFDWSEKTASGFSSLIWRSQWENSKSLPLRQKIEKYNKEDCRALETVTVAVAQIIQQQADPLALTNYQVAHTDSLEVDKRPPRFKKANFLVPEFEHINDAAYWNYQREKVYVKTNKRLQRTSKSKARENPKPIPINKVIEWARRPSICLECGSREINKYGRKSKVVYDLKITKNGIKRWVVKYHFNRYICKQCNSPVQIEEPPWTGSRYGLGLRAYAVYQVIELRLSQGVVAKSLNGLFGFSLSRGSIKPLKSKAAQYYKATYQKLLNDITTGKLIHADETSAQPLQKGYIWVLTNMESVVYFYTETREGSTVQEMLHDFQGVLVSDFYNVYDSFDCPQQKCLIHLIRDLNNDLVRHPFDEEFKDLVQYFALLLKPVIETVDRFGLKKHFLKKHIIAVEQFYKYLSKQDFRSETSNKYKKRFEKNHDKLFTFLNYDNTPWNNNNAERAVKSFAMLRNGFVGKSSEKGIEEYLILLSIYETCKYRGISFLNFMRSGLVDINSFEKM